MRRDEGKRRKSNGDEISALHFHCQESRALKPIPLYPFLLITMLTFPSLSLNSQWKIFTRETPSVESL